MQLKYGVLRGLLVVAATAPGFWFSSAHAQVTNYAPNLPVALQAAKQERVPVKKPEPQLVMPQPEELLDLIRTTIVALNQANQTGNYTVLRDLSAPDLRNANDASRLGIIFQVLREQAIDLTPLLHISPEVSEAPAIGAEGLLRIAGFFPTHPLRVTFDLSFQYFESRWRPYTISVYLARLEAGLQTPAAPRQAPAKNR